MPDKTPHGHTAGFPFHGDTTPTCSGFPCRSSGSGLTCFRVSPYVPQYPYTLLRPFPPAGVNGASQVPGLSLPACHGLWTPADLIILAISDDFRVAFGTVKSLGIRNNPYFEAVPALQGARTPLRPTGFSVYASPVLFAGILPDSATSARLDSGGWLTLSRQGLSP